MPERLDLPRDSMAPGYFQNLVNDVITRDLLIDRRRGRSR